MWLIAAILGAGSFFATLTLFKPQRILVLAAATGVVWQAHWFFLTLIKRSFFPEVAPLIFWWAGVLIVTSVWISIWSFSAKQSLTALLSSSWIRDGVILILIGGTLCAAALIFGYNGLVGTDWVTHGFFNGDTATFLSLTERSLQTQTLVQENVFAGNGELEYPTLLHAAVAELVQLASVQDYWFQLLPWMTYAQIMLTIPIFFLLWDVVFPEPSERWRLWFGIPSRPLIYLLQAGVVSYVMFLSWDNFVYPQSHFFLTALFLLAAALFVVGWSKAGQQQWPAVVVASIITFLLMRSNAVTGSAAVALAMVFGLGRAGDRGRPVVERAIYALTLPVWPVLMLAFSPGNAQFGLPHFSYSAVLDILRLALPLIILLVIALTRVPRQTFLTGGVLALAAMAFITFFFSQRNIIVDNASRFFYHALLIGFPLVLHSLIQIYYWLRRQLHYTSLTLIESLTAHGAVAIVILLLLFPALASVASAHDNLMFKDERRVSLEEQVVFGWIKQNTAPDSVFIMNPGRPLSLPVFTGRSLVRADYWLSPDDELLAQVKSAFVGDQEAQKQITGHADYLILCPIEQQVWNTDSLEEVFKNEAFTVYKLR